MTPDALIVGAGIGGLAAGVALRKAGWQVQIFERASSPRELGFALSLAPNAMLALRELGVANQVAAAGAAAGLMEVRGDGGQLLKRFDVAAAVGQVPSVFAARDALHGALLSATDPQALALDSAATEFAVDATGVTLTLADGRTAHGDVLVGADGVASVVRARLHPREPPPRPSGYVALRAVAREAGPLLGRLSGAAYLARGIEAATMKAGGDTLYWYMSLLAHDVPDPNEAPRAIAERCATRLDGTFRAVLDATADGDIRLDQLYRRDPIADWGAGPVTLLGDAAHPMLPHTGQGAAQSLEDAVALGLALARGGDAAAGLRRYERVRAARTRRIVQRGPRIAAFTTTVNPVIRALRSALIRLAPADRLAREFLLADNTDPHAALRMQA